MITLFIILTLLSTLNAVTLGIVAHEWQSDIYTALAIANVGIIVAFVIGSIAFVI